MHESHAHLALSEFDIVAGEIAATLHRVGVPPHEHSEFTAIIESYRSMVVGPPEPGAGASAAPSVSPIRRWPKGLGIPLGTAKSRIRPG